MSEDDIDEIVLPEIDGNTCVVCGKGGAIKCYGAKICGSCKAFFLRISTIKEAVPCCSDAGKCVTRDFVLRDNEKCRACRYKKCLEVGLNPAVTARRKGCTLREKRSNVGYDRRAKGKGLISICDSNQSLDEQSVHRIDTRETQMIALISPSHQILNSTQSSSSASIQMMVNLEKVFMNDDYSAPNRLNFVYDVSGSVTEMLRNPTGVCSRVPIDFGGAFPLNAGMDDLRRIPVRVLARLSVHMSDWLRNIPEFWELCENERVLLFCQRFLSYEYLLMYYYSYKKGFNGIFLPFGTSISSEDLTTYRTLSVGSKVMLKCGFNTIMPSMKRAKLGDEEYVLLKNISIFSSALGFSDAGADIIRKAYTKYSGLLFEHLEKTTSPKGEVIRRFTEIMAIPSYLQNEAYMMNPQFGGYILCDEGGMECTLAREIFNKF